MTRRYMAYFRDFLKFIRIETCIFISAIAASGYIFFNGFGPLLVHVFLAVFFLSGAAYAINHITDKEEDAVNNSKVSPLAAGSSGAAVVAAFLVAGIAFSLSFAPFSLLLYAASIPMIVAYSVLRVKRVLLLKNVYTGFVIGIAFLVGSQSGPGNALLWSYFVSVFLMGFMLNLLGDIRGHKGDMSAGVRTIATAFGIGKAKKVFYGMSAAFSGWVLVSGAHYLVPVIPFAVTVSAFLSRDRHRGARAGMLSSFVFLFAYLLVSGFWGD